MQQITINMKYEFPLNEKIRTMLRLEDLFHRWDFFYAQEAALNHHSALLTLFEISEIAARLDLRTDLGKEIDRQNQLLSQLRNNPEIDVDALELLLNNLQQASQHINDLFSKGILTTLDKDWLYAIKSRSTIPGGSCQFDLPSYYAWQQQTHIERQKDLQAWIQPILGLKEATILVLDLLRKSNIQTTQIAHKGIYQQMLSGKIFQLLQIHLMPPYNNYIPEVSGNKYMITIRFHQLDIKKQLRQSSDDIEFKLMLCNF
jgi:cell division protein ZapD